MKKYKKVQEAYLEEGTVALYQAYVVGGASFWNLVKYELFVNFTAGIPGALGLLIRKTLYPLMISRCGKGTVWGRNMVLRYPQKIRIEDYCIFDDGCVLDAKGENNQGISIGNSCMFGRQTILGCKNSDIFIGNHVGLGAHCILHAVDSSPVKIEDHVVIGPKVYLAAGGDYHYDRTDIPIGQQGIDCKGGIHVGRNCWIGANTVVLDGVKIGNDAIVGAGSVVTKDLSPFAVAAGNPAKVIKIRGE